MLVTTQVPLFNRPVIIVRDGKAVFNDGIPRGETPQEMDWEQALTVFPEGDLAALSASPLTHFRSSERLVLVLKGGFALLNGGVARVFKGGYAAGYWHAHLNLEPYSLGFGFTGTTLATECYATAIAAGAEIVPPKPGKAYLFLTPEDRALSGHVYGVFDLGKDNFAQVWREIRGEAKVPQWPHVVFHKM
jgi:hypothetical protein